jgi:hypothetical protein
MVRLGTPAIFVAFDLRPFRIGQLGARPGCFLDPVS